MCAPFSSSVAEIVRRYDPDFADFHRRLQGKPKKVIRVALAHKLPVRLNAKARDARKPSPQLDKPDSSSPAASRHGRMGALFPPP